MSQRRLTQPTQAKVVTHSTDPSLRLRLWLALLAVLALLALLALAQPLHAQDAGATPPPAEEPAAEPAAAGAVAGAAAQAASPDEINSVARQLWCPLCSGVRLDACELKACAQMKDVIGEKLTAGEDVQSIKNYFVAQYGPQVLGEPPLEGFNWLAWLLPVIALVGGGLFLWSRTRTMIKPAQAAAAAGDRAAAAGAGATAATGDPYSRQLDEELKHYD